MNNFAHHLIVDLLTVRCPACQKLYQVDTSAIHSLTPHFQCKACQSIFAFEFPPANPGQAIGFLVHQGDDLQIGAEGPPVIRQGDPGLLRLWNLIFEDYDDEERHEDFVKACLKMRALPLALQKYSDLRSALGTDALCEKYLNQVESMMNVKAELSDTNPGPIGVINYQDFAKWIQSKNWKRVLYWGPLIISLVLILIGFSNSGSRNMIGVGFAVAILSYGLITVTKGRIQISDFLK